MPKSTIFLDNKFIYVDELFIDKLSPWRLTGKGVFETMRTYQGNVYALDAHLKRLKKGLEKLKVPLLFSKTKLQENVLGCLKKNKVLNGRVRLTVWQEKECLRTSIIAVKAVISRQQYRKGLKAVCVSFNPSSKLFGGSLKSINYLPYWKAYAQAQSKGFDEALLVGSNGSLIEGSRSNVFVVVKGKVLTPALKTHCLSGITRQMIFTLGKNEGIMVRAKEIKKRDLINSQEAFITNSFLEVMPLVQVEKHKIASGSPGPITSLLHNKYKENIAKDQL